jgi:hypothetical protein
MKRALWGSNPGSSGLSPSPDARWERTRVNQKRRPVKLTPAGTE